MQLTVHLRDGLQLHLHRVMVAHLQSLENKPMKRFGDYKQRRRIIHKLVHVTYLKTSCLHRTLGSVPAVVLDWFVSLIFLFFFPPMWELWVVPTNVHNRHLCDSSETGLGM